MANLGGNPTQFTFITKDGKFPLGAQYERLAPFQKEGVARAGNGFGWGLIDREGHWIAGPNLATVSAFSEGLAAAALGAKYQHVSTWRWGYLDKSGNWVVKPQFVAALSFAEGLAAVFTQASSLTSKSKCGYIDRTGNWIISSQFEDCASFKNGLASVSLDGRIRKIDKTGVDTKMGSLEASLDYHEGLAVRVTPVAPDLAKKFGCDTFHEKCAGYVDTGGNWAIPARYSIASAFGELRPGIAHVSGDINGEYGSWYIDHSGNTVIDASNPLSYVEYGFSEGLAALRDPKNRPNGKFGFINGDGSWVIKPQFQNVTNFENGAAGVELDNLWGLIDKQGNWLLKPKFYDIITSGRSNLLQWSASDSEWQQWFAYEMRR